MGERFIGEKYIIETEKPFDKLEDWDEILVVDSSSDSKDGLELRWGIVDYYLPLDEDVGELLKDKEGIDKFVERVIHICETAEPEAVGYSYGQDINDNEVVCSECFRHTQKCIDCSSVWFEDGFFGG